MKIVLTLRGQEKIEVERFETDYLRVVGSIFYYGKENENKIDLKNIIYLEVFDDK